MAEGAEQASIARRVWKATDNALAAVSAAFSEGVGTNIARARRVLHDAAAGGLLQSISAQWADLVAKGKAGDARLAAPEVRTALDALLQDLDTEVPDERRLTILRRAFLATAIGSESDPDGAMALLHMQTARKLTGLQSLILLVGYRFREIAVHEDDASWPLRRDGRGNEWLEAVMKHSGIRFRSVAERECVALRDALLIHASNEGAPVLTGPGNGVFSHYGLAFCEFLERAEPLPSGSAP